MKKNKEGLYDRLKEIFKKTITSKNRYNGSIKNMEFFKLSIQAVSNNSMYRLIGSDLFTFNTTYEGKEAILMIFSMPLSSDSGTKHIAEKVMEIITTVEKCFVTIDYSKSQESKEDKFVYVALIKTYDQKFLEFLERKKFVLKTATKKKAKKKGDKGVTNNEPESSEKSDETNPVEGSEHTSDNQASAG